ncbi:tctex1 domain-containing protein 1 [Trichogramma pretiosum]|uniref:tctex1 domain-containing protein 1 n=1 Tax=Trichogramma pretiosum TaxID=7493 RepID=UPI0006C96D57|nr:tctex1 domain-containing protein 1 [Trichogramma pretiosum]
MQQQDKKGKKTIDSVSLHPSVLELEAANRRSGRRSTFNGQRPSISWRTNAGFKTPKFANSYRLEPMLPFDKRVSDKFLVAAMTEYLRDRVYCADEAAKWCSDIAIQVRDKLYKTDFDRVKYLVTVSIYENADQGLTCVQGKMWDPERDYCSFHVHEELSFFAVGMVVVTYYE